MIHQPEDDAPSRFAELALPGNSRQHRYSIFIFLHLQHCISMDYLPTSSSSTNPEHGAYEQPSFSHRLCFGQQPKI
ncbi:uncharacterized protein [Physcomitrium patens]|uniref:uncharacterized protein isoform X1 n=1 Tax=Physcomitrium patens TaxID=3218 RepID=UPI003CCD1537